MAFVNSEEQLWLTLKSIAGDEGLDLYDLEKFGAASLRIFVDKPKGSAERVTSGDCSRLVRRLMIFFTAEGAKFGISAEPQIEVSSPGVNRHLRLKEQYEGALGERVRLCLNGSGDAGLVVGVLRQVSSAAIEIVEEATNQLRLIEFSKIGRGNVEFRFE